MEAVKALKEVCLEMGCSYDSPNASKNAVPATDYVGLFHILKLYQHFYCYPPESDTLDPFEIQCKPKPNDFTNFADYFVLKVLRSQHVVLDC
jgi:hypothetical protein